jgi:hypothetical protein
MANLRSLGLPRVDGTPKAAWEQSVEDVAAAGLLKEAETGESSSPCPFPFGERLA